MTQPVPPVVLHAIRFTDAGFDVNATVTLQGNTWSGPHQLDLPETATSAEIEAALLALYGLAE